MKPRQQVSRTAIDLIKRFEGYRARSARLADGRWTIGYGHTLTAREGVEISEADAEALLIYDLIAVAHAVNEWTFTPLTQNQFDALCAFAFNIGVDNFRSSSVLRRINDGDLLQAALAMELWRRADFEGEKIVVDALVRRRAAEKIMFLTPPDGFVPAPSPVLRPNLDFDSMGLVPREAPAALRTDLAGEVAAVVREEPARPSAAEERLGPAQEAAAAVSARLAAIFPEEEPDDSQTQTPEPDAVQPNVEDAMEEEPRVQAAAAVRQWSISATARATRRGFGAAPVDPVTAAAVEAVTPANEFEAPEPPPVEDEEALDVESPFAAPIQPAGRRGGQRRSAGGMAALALVGLALFVGGLWAGLGRAGLEAELVQAAWAVCVAGVALFSVSAYLGLNRLGQPLPRSEDQA